MTFGNEDSTSTRSLRNQDPTQIPLLPTSVGSQAVQGEQPHPRNAAQERMNENSGHPVKDNFEPRVTSQSGANAEGIESRNRKPTTEESFDKLLKEVVRYDDDRVKNWKEDIDTLLVFAGLFSAVVTAFAIESYQWLSEDPADATVTLLIQISAQLNASQSIIPSRPSFEADPSSVRINCFWFLSLIFSLTSALFGLLCKQWLREHQRDTQTRTPAEALALRQLRRDSFEKWGVSSFLSALPILLEVALLLFFVGVLDLLWNRNPIPFGVCFVAVMFSAGLYFVTAALPTLTVPGNLVWKIRDRKFDELFYQFICPYKSPQARVVYYLSCTLFRLLPRLGRTESPLTRKFKGMFDLTQNPATDWSSFDLRVVRQFDAHPLPFTISDPFYLKVYEIRAFQWAVTMFQDSPSMIPHLQNILGTISPSVAMSVIFGGWNYAMAEDIPKSDVKLRVQDPRAFDASKHQEDWYISNVPLPNIKHPALHHSEGIKLLYCHQYWLEMARRSRLSDYVEYLLLRTSIESCQPTTLVPFPVVDSLWTHEDPDVRKHSLGLLRFLRDAWKTTPPGYPYDCECLAFIVALTRHLNRTDRTSELLTSSRGQSFIRFIHQQIISRRLYDNWGPGDDTRRALLMSAWGRATQRANEVGNLPADYFLPIPNPGEDPPAPLAFTVDLSSIRYSVETVNPPLTSADAVGEDGNPIADQLENGHEADNANAMEQDPSGGGTGGSGADERV